MTAQLDPDSVNDFAKRFGENLALHHKRVGLSQEQLSERVARMDTFIKLIGRAWRAPRGPSRRAEMVTGMMTVGKFI
jgi:ribosome-binding protein aMBF1 (putative translation factor)